MPHTALQPLGVDTDTFSPARRVLNLRQALGLPADTRLLVYAGRFSGEKNIDVLMQAMARLGRPYHLLMIGGGRDATPARNVTVMPYRRAGIELAEWLASCDALVHAGSNETFGLVLLEAMACGLPVVGVNAGAVPEFVDEQVGQLAGRAMPKAWRGRSPTCTSATCAHWAWRRATGCWRRFTWSLAFEQLLRTYARVGVAHAEEAEAGQAGGLSPGRSPSALPVNVDRFGCPTGRAQSAAWSFDYVMSVRAVHSGPLAANGADALSRRAGRRRSTPSHAIAGRRMVPPCAAGGRMAQRSRRGARRHPVRGAWLRYVASGSHRPAPAPGARAGRIAAAISRRRGQLRLADQDCTLAYLADRHKAKQTALRLVTDGVRPLRCGQLPDCPVNLHLLGHSTGAYVIREAFDDADDMQLKNAAWNVSQICLVAADVSSRSLAAEIREGASLYTHCQRLTNYFSRHDIARTCRT